MLDTGAGFFTNFHPRLHRYAGELGLVDTMARLSRRNVLVQRAWPYPWLWGPWRAFSVSL